jgi:hypothetical protein
MRSFMPSIPRYARKEKRGQGFVKLTSLPAEGRGTE